VSAPGLYHSTEEDPYAKYRFSSSAYEKEIEQVVEDFTKTGSLPASRASIAPSYDTSSIPPSTYIDTCTSQDSAAEDVTTKPPAPVIPHQTWTPRGTGGAYDAAASLASELDGQ